MTDAAAEDRFEAMGRQIMAGLEKPDLDPKRLRVWYQQIGIAADDLIQDALDIERFNQRCERNERE